MNPFAYEAVLRDNWVRAKPFKVSPLGMGNINNTYLIELEQERFVFQKINPIFNAEINDDIADVSVYLAANHIRAPRLIKTLLGTNYARSDAQIFRLQEYVDGVSKLQFENVEQVFSAAQLLGSTHCALARYVLPFHSTRPYIHRPRDHAALLQASVDAHRTHAWHDRVLPLARSICREIEALSATMNIEKRPCHGDPKADNFLFHENRAVALVDWDTVNLGYWVYELGDALRSWCNKLGEHSEDAQFERVFYDAALSGYFSTCKDNWASDEKSSINRGLQLIALELSARFLKDVVDTPYFKWDAAHFESCSHHNWVRAMGQYNLFLQVSELQTGRL